jgi:uncharacterized protein (UPF0261 family)
VARLIGRKLSLAQGPVAYILPVDGVEAWDRPGEPMHDPGALAAFVEETRRNVPANVGLVEIDAHINDQAFADAALAIFDDWVSHGIVAGAAAAQA